MAKVFISYRREDSAGWTGRIADHLSQVLGADQVFIDVDDIEPGDDFSEVLRNRLRRIEVLIAVIGPRWLDATDADGNRRLANEGDYLRSEIAAGLAADDVRVVPVLVGGAEMPPADQLPPDLAALSLRQAVEVSQTRFRGDMERLTVAIQGEPPPPSFIDRVGSAMRSPLAWLFVLALVAAVVVGWLVLGGDEQADPDDPRVPGVVDFTEVQAVQIMNDLGIEVSIETEESEQEAGVVIGQDPVAGERATVVELVVSLGPPPPDMPNVVGLVSADAVAQLEGAGIVSTLEESGSDEDRGIVFGQFPEPGVETGSAVLFVSSGRELPVIPDVTGEAIADARARMPAEVTVSEREEESPSSAGTVVDQTPRGGERSDVVELVVSVGPGLPVVPLVVGLEQAAAEAELAGAGIGATVVDQAAPQPAGIVVAQDPGEGERAAELTMTISSGPTIDHYAGTWVNIDAETRGMTRLVIATDGGGATINGFGSCSPSDCDWGEVDATFDDDRLVGIYEFAFKTTTLRAELAGELLVVERFDAYAEGDSRSDKITTDFFRAERSAVTTTGLLEVVVLDPELTTSLLEVRPELTSDLTRIDPDGIVDFVPTP
ncbi:MAG: PASTA domain-containing protein [Ilumatobacter sp.]|uniref:PASTA domain-containing protein n=1 Tax=Ilumatobacter sp. TaxID=1967498 RepID=UPI0026146A64|nr:PASTA domain-containing protein [Ilumatobacter sp.]MDJ0768171.1 PASTA domain-containing protein [Ilumatobacter sp.]